MKRLLIALVLSLSLSAPAFAATEVVEIYFLPLHEAADVARSQLSDNGKVATMPSQRILVIDDDRTHLNKAISLLKKLDHPPGQYTAYVNIEDVKSERRKSASTSGQVQLGRLSGGWARVQLQHSTTHSNHRQAFQLRISGNRPGSIETGTLQSFSRETRLWLSGYGVVRANSVELIPVTSGFNVLVSPVGSDQVRVRIVPWMQRTEAQVRGQHEVLVDLGSSQNPATPPSPTADMRLNARPELNQNRIIELTGAATELVIPVDKSVTIAASNMEAEKLGQALLSGRSTIGKRQIVMHLRVSKSQ